MTVTNADFRFIVPEQLQQIGIDPGPMLIEPEGRNTAPAVLAAALCADVRDPETALLVASSGHVIGDISAFHAAIVQGVDRIAATGDLITCGVTPTYTETGYGYLELAEKSNGAGAVDLKRTVVKSGAALSLQSHIHRAEHWIMVAGTARVTIDDNIKLVSENQSVYIPLGAKHRMETPGKLPMILIEVQTGGYLGEDDIIRYDDMYARVRESTNNAD